MRIHLSDSAPTLATVADRVAAVHRAGLNGYFTAETAHDPFLPLAAVAGGTAVTLGTAVAVAFARSPMSVAYLASDLAEATGGRFVLGLGSQVKTHVTHRFSMPFDPPVGRMREYLAALRAIWRGWATGERLRFRGDHYTFTVMTDFFTPHAHPHLPPPVYLAGVGPVMTRTAGELADGLFVHAFTTPEYVREVTLPELARGRARADRARGAVSVAAFALVATGATEERMAAAVQDVRRRIAFYGSTPAYVPVLAGRGWQQLHSELSALARRRRYTDMTALITDDVLDAFAVRAEPDRLAATLADRYGSWCDDLLVDADLTGGDASLWASVAADLARPAAAYPGDPPE